MTNVSDYPVSVDDRRLDDLAVGLETSGLTLGGLRSADQPLAGLDGEVASLNDSREPSTFTLGMLVRGTDADGFVPVGAFGQTLYQSNLEALKHLLCRTGALLNVRRVVDKATSAYRTNLTPNPTFRATTGTVEVRRNLSPNPSFRATSGTVEVRRNYSTDPHGLSAAAWMNYTGVSTIESLAAGAYSGATGIVATSDGVVTTPRISNSGTQPLNFAVGDVITLQAKVRAATGTGWQAGATPMMLLRGPLTAGGEWSSSAIVYTVLSGGWWQCSITATIPAGATGAVVLNIGISNSAVAPPVTAKFHVDEIGVEKIGALLPFMSGSSAAADGLTYSWVGTVNASASIATGVGIADWGGGSHKAWLGADGASMRFLPTAANANIYQTAGCPAAPGDVFAASFEVDADTAGDTARLQVFFYSPGLSAGASTGELAVTNPQVLAAVTTAAPAGTTLVRSSVLITNAIGRLFTIRQSLVEKAAVVLPFFDGATPVIPGEGLTYSWVGAANASASIATGAAIPVASPFTAYTIPAGAIVGWQSTPGVFRVLLKSDIAASGIIGYTNGGHIPAVEGSYYSPRLKARQIAGAANESLAFSLATYTAAPGYVAALNNNTTIAVTVGGAWLDVAAQALAPAAAGSVSVRFLVRADGGGALAGTIYEFKEALIEVVPANGTAGAYFDGSSAGAGWTGNPETTTSATSSSDVQATAKVVDSVTPEDAPGDYGRLTVALKLPGVYWRSVLPLTWTSGALTSGLWMDVPTLEGSSAPIDDAVIVVTGPANAGVQVYDVATLTYVRLNEAIPAGQAWRINCDTWESRVGVGLTVDSADSAGTDKSGVTDQAGLYPRLLRLNPRLVGAVRKVRATVVGAGFTSATTLTIKARRAHL